jgi:hypothetical protein
VVGSLKNRLKFDVMLETTVGLLFNKANVKNRLSFCSHFLFIVSGESPSQASQPDNENIR